MRIKRLYPQDYIALRMLAHCGNVTTDNLIAAGLSKTRVINYKNDGLIKPIMYRQKSKQSYPDVAWGVTSLGGRYISKVIGIPVASSKNSVRHNLAVAHEYSLLLAHHEPYSMFILTELETKDLVLAEIEALKTYQFVDYLYWHNKYITRKMSMPDITYIIADSRHCIEIITSNYKAEHKDAKRLTAKFLGADLKEVMI